MQQGLPSYGNKHAAAAVVGNAYKSVGKPWGQKSAPSCGKCVIDLALETDLDSSQKENGGLYLYLPIMVRRSS